MKTVLVGAVEGSLAALKTLIAANQTPDLVVTLPPELASRHSDFANLADVAEAAGADVHFTRRSDSPETIAAIRTVEPDIVMVIGWSQLCGTEFRATPRIGCLGFHPSVLPKLRGRGVVAWTVALGETESGGTLFWLSEGADTGDIAAQARFVIDPAKITARDLYDRQVAAMCDMLPPLLDQIDKGHVPRHPQNDEEATICARRTAEDGRINWAWSAKEIDRLIRAAGEPYPGAFTVTPHGERLIIDEARVSPLKGRFIGFPGQIQTIDQSGFSVSCGNYECLEVLRWRGPKEPLKLHAILGRKRIADD